MVAVLLITGAIAIAFEKSVESAFKNKLLSLTSRYESTYRSVVSAKGAVQDDSEIGTTWVHGLRSNYVIIRNVLSIKALEAMAGTPVFLKGPHKNGKLDLHSKTEFGHYNPRFLMWLAKEMTKALKDPAFVKGAGVLYEKRFKQMARSYYITHPKHGGRFDDLTAKGLKRADMLFHIHTARRFWKRRTVDRTDMQFFSVLQSAMAVLDPGFPKKLGGRPSHPLPGVEEAVGVYESVDDKNATIVIRDKKYHMHYHGIEIVSETVYDLEILDKITTDGRTLTAGKYLRLTSGDGEVLLYGINSWNRQEVSLTYIPRGRILVYKKAGDSSSKKINSEH